MCYNSKMDRVVNRKANNIVRYIIKRYEEINGYPISITSIHKILWFAEVKHYKKNHHSMSQLEFIKNEYGPFVSDMDTLLFQMERSEMINSSRDQHPLGAIVYNYTDNNKTPMSEINEEHKKIIGDTIDQYKGWNSTKLSNKSHDSRAWSVTSMREEIPYFLMLDITNNYDKSVFDWAKKAVEEYEATLSASC